MRPFPVLIVLINYPAALRFLGFARPRDLAFGITGLYASPCFFAAPVFKTPVMLI